MLCFSFVKASPADATPCIIEPLTDTTVTEGQSLTLSCCINGLQLIINWFHNGKVKNKLDFLNQTINGIFFFY